jgi:DNA processing protein
MRCFGEVAGAYLTSSKRAKNRMTSSGFSREDAEEHGFSLGVVATLGVSTLPGVGPATLRQLGDPNQVLDLFAREDVESFESAINAKGAKFSARGAGISGWLDLRERVWRAGRAMTAELLDHRVRCITPSSALYPARLNDLGSRRPNWLFLRGNTALLGAQSAAVVGTRDPSETGEFLTRYAVSVCREFGLPVVSGLAKGIDSTAHEWSLKLCLPTISVLGSGLLVPYPARNIGLADKIVNEGGLLISEYLPRQPPAAELFVWRNRLQACISDTVIATEWKRTSGTAHTVRFANELNRTSISISLLGGPDAPDAGRGARHFVLPSQHFEFVSSIASTRAANEQRDQTNSHAANGSSAHKPPLAVVPADPPLDADAQASLF